MSQSHTPEQVKHLRDRCVWIHCIRTRIHIPTYILKNDKKHNYYPLQIPISSSKVSPSILYYYQYSEINESLNYFTFHNLIFLCKQRQSLMVAIVTEAKDEKHDCLNWYFLNARYSICMHRLWDVIFFFKNNDQNIVNFQIYFSYL